MAINLAFIDFVIPVSRIIESYPGGWEQCLYDHRRRVGGAVWFDEYLFHSGAMSGEDMDLIVSRWKAFGFESTECPDGLESWKDFCVVESLLQQVIGERRPCKWLVVDPYQRIAYLYGTEPGLVVGRRPFLRRNTMISSQSYKLRRLMMRCTVHLMHWVRRRNKTSTSLLNKFLIYLQK
jgi:hypothetical protein